MVYGVLGLGLCAVGLVGLLFPSFLGMRLGVAHSVLNLLTGGLAAYLAWRGATLGTSSFCAIFGTGSVLLGMAGFAAEQNGELLTVIPGNLELGRADHVFHLLVGVAFLVGGAWKRGPLD